MIGYDGAMEVGKTVEHQGKYNDASSSSNPKISQASSQEDDYMEAVEKYDPRQVNQETMKEVQEESKIEMNKSNQEVHGG